MLNQDYAHYIAELACRAFARHDYFAFRMLTGKFNSLISWDFSRCSTSQQQVGSMVNL